MSSPDSGPTRAQAEDFARSWDSSVGTISSHATAHGIDDYFVRTTANDELLIGGQWIWAGGVFRDYQGTADPLHAALDEADAFGELDDFR